MIALPSWHPPDGRCPTHPWRGAPADACLEFHQYDDRHQQLRPHHCARVCLRVDTRDLNDDRRGSPYRRPCHCLCSHESANAAAGRCSMLHFAHAGGTANRVGATSPNASNANNPDSAWSSVHR